jgi:hypothetical protein
MSKRTPIKKENLGAFVEIREISGLFSQEEG